LSLNSGVLLHVVLDTNVWLDWLLFADPDAVRVQLALATLPHTLLATNDTAAELFEVLHRPALARANKAIPIMQAQFHALATLVPTPPVCDRTALLCSDRDDQKFIDLALAYPVSVLLSKDKAVLKLGRRLKHQPQVQIKHPALWQPVTL
jgi:predicted nucleic acid-binding protein